MILHLYFGFMLVICGGCLEGIRRLLRRERMALGIRP
jgi:hypothetical protein